jgi:hypothetical protein
VAVLDVFNWQGLSVAPNDTLLTEEPTWTRLDSGIEGLRVAEISTRRGRQDEFERTDTGTCSAVLRDRAGEADPSLVDWMSCPFAFAVRNPVTDTWHPRFRGAVDDHSYDLSPGQTKGDVVIEAVDALDYFANFELAPGLAGDSPPAQSEGYVFYEDSNSSSVGGPVGVRVHQALGNASWPSGLSSVFTGNAALLEAVYSPGESILTVIHDAADAEFPGVANFFVDKYGVVCFHGRLARFDPAGVSATATHWDFNEWTVGEGGVQITWPFTSTRSRGLIRNAAMCFPQKLPNGSPFPAADRVNQVVTDATSIARHGVRSWSAENLLTKEGVTSGLPGPEECLTYAQYVVDNYASAEPTVRQISFKVLRPDDPRAAALWPLLCEIDISDQITLTKSHPGGGGFTSSVHFVEGISETWRPLVKDLDTGYPYCEMTLDLSPAAYWGTAPADWTS